MEELTGDGQLALTLQKSSIGSDELLRLITQYPLAKIPSSEVLRLPRACSQIPQRTSFFPYICHVYIPRS
jgi:hypothetical protein